MAEDVVGSDGSDGSEGKDGSDGSDGEGGRARRADARRNRLRILAAAWRLLSVKDPAEISMEEVARDADVGKGTLYRHYPTKECLIDALVRDGAHKAVQWMRERIPPEADAATKLRAMISLCYDMYEAYHISFDLMAGVGHITRDIRAMHDAEDGHEHPATLMMARVQAILEQGVREGLFRPLDPAYAAAAIFSLVSPIAFLKQRQRLGYSRAQIEERVVDFILSAVGSS